MPIVLAQRPKGQDSVHPVLERYLLGETSARVFFDVLAYALKDGIKVANAIQFSLETETAETCENGGILIDGASFGFPLLAGIHLYSSGRSWPNRYLASGELNFARRQIVAVGAASQKLRFAMQNLPPEGLLFLPQCNVRRLRRASKWSSAPLFALPRGIQSGVALFLAHAAKE